MLKVKLLCFFTLLALSLQGQYAQAYYTTPKPTGLSLVAPYNAYTAGFSMHKRSTVSRYNLNKNLDGYLLCFGSGVFQGLRDAVRDEYPSFEEAFLDNQKENKFWNPRYYPKGKSDGYYMFDILHKGCLLGGGIAFTIGEKAPWWHYFLNFAGGSLSHVVGYYVIYSGIKR